VREYRILSRASSGARLSLLYRCTENASNKDGQPYFDFGQRPCNTTADAGTKQDMKSSVSSKITYQE
jgi:hypothetical protein